MCCIRSGAGFGCGLFGLRREWHRGFCEDLQLGMLPCLVRLVAVITTVYQQILVTRSLRAAVDGFRPSM
jgi:hypothetical protein